MIPSQNRVLSLLVAMNLRLGMPDAVALNHARGLAGLLADYCGGDVLYVSRKTPAGREASDAAIAARRAKGSSTRAIAKALGISKSSVHRALSRMGMVSRDSP